MINIKKHTNHVGPLTYSVIITTFLCLLPLIFNIFIPWSLKLLQIQSKYVITNSPEPAKSVCYIISAIHYYVVTSHFETKIQQCFVRYKLESLRS
jgi:hypothetical protein